MPAEDHYIEDANLSIAWGKALRLVSRRGFKEVVPLVVAVTGFDADGQPVEDTAIRNNLDALLARAHHYSSETVANTIFPESLWNPAQPRARLFERYERIRSRLRSADRQNAKGRYFDRLISGGSEDHPNQIEFALCAFNARSGVRRSMLQFAVFDPHKDHSNAAQLGFPCLQHVTLAPTDDGVALNAFYATQYVVERAYGNYLGLCRLGRFLAHELGTKLVRMTCFTGIAECDATKRDIAPVVAEVNRALTSRSTEGEEETVHESE